MDSRVAKLLRRKQFAQRTSEWYEIRTSMITASSAASLLNKNKKTCESYVNEYDLTETFDYSEKCCNPYSSKKQYFLDKCKQKTFFGNTATMWGQKYEPVVTDIYSKEHNKDVMEFGLLAHQDPELSFIGASPDGITPDGVMIEIKCPFRRKITGIPPLYYWIQVQLQLEVCDLEYCDFVEYEFMEFETKEEFINDDLLDIDVINKGLFIKVERITKEGLIDTKGTQYVYPEKQFIDNPEDLFKWADTQLSKLPDMISEDFTDSKFNFSLVFWKVVNKSITRITRDKEWFNRIVPDLRQGFEKMKYYQTEENYKELLVKKIPARFVKGETLVLEEPTQEHQEEACVLNDE
jgi:putative phage-type endonuclease